MLISVGVLLNTTQRSNATKVFAISTSPHHETNAKKFMDFFFDFVNISPIALIVFYCEIVLTCGILACPVTQVSHL